MAMAQRRSIGSTVGAAVAAGVVAVSLVAPTRLPAAMAAAGHRTSYCLWYVSALFDLDVRGVADQMKVSDGAKLPYQPLTPAWISLFEREAQAIAVAKVGPPPRALSSFPTRAVVELARAEAAFFASLHPGHYTVAQERRVEQLAREYRKLPYLSASAPACQVATAGPDGAWVDGSLFTFSTKPTAGQLAVLRRLLPVWNTVALVSPPVTRQQDQRILNVLRQGLTGTWPAATPTAYDLAAEDHNAALEALNRMRTHPLPASIPSTMNKAVALYLQSRVAWYYVAGIALSTETISPTSYRAMLALNAKMNHEWQAFVRQLEALAQQGGIPGAGIINLMACNREGGCPNLRG